MPRSKFSDWVNLESGKKIEKFNALPARTRIGIIMLVSSFIIGYGVPVFILIISGINKKLLAGFISGSIVYIFSWILGAIGLAMAGKDCIKYPVILFAKFVKKLFPDYFRKRSGS